MTQMSLTASVTVGEIEQLLRKTGQIVLPENAVLNVHACRPMQGGSQRDPHVVGIRLEWRWTEDDTDAR